MRKKSNYFCIVILTVCFSVNVYADDKYIADPMALFEPANLYSALIPIEEFVNISVFFSGSADNVGLNKNELEDFARLKFKNNFSGIKYRHLPLNSPEIARAIGAKIGGWAGIGAALNDEKEQEKKLGIISIRMLTSGYAYPIACHITFTGGSLQDLKSYQIEFSGTVSRQTIKEKVKIAINEAMEGMAIAFFKARGEL